MKLMTKKIEKELGAHPIGSTACGKNARVIVKYFNPCGSGTWLITEGEKEDTGDWLLFGYCHIFEWEWGYVRLSELEKIKVPPFNLGIERDLYCEGRTVGELAKE